CRAIEGKEDRSRPRRLPVNMPGNQFLPRSRFSRYQDCDIAGSYLVYLVNDIEHGSAANYEARHYGLYALVKASRCSAACCCSKRACFKAKFRLSQQRLQSSK